MLGKYGGLTGAVATTTGIVWQATSTALASTALRIVACRVMTAIYDAVRYANLASTQHNCTTRGRGGMGRGERPLGVSARVVQLARMAAHGGKCCSPQKGFRAPAPPLLPHVLYSGSNTKIELQLITSQTQKSTARPAWNRRASDATQLALPKLGLVAGSGGL